MRDGFNIAKVDDEDMRILYQNYRLKTLPWSLGYDLKPREVLAAALEIIEANYPYAWSVRHRANPVMVIFGRSAWDGVVLENPIFSARSSARERYEASISILEQLKQEVPVLVACADDQKRFFERLQDHKVVRKVGKLHDMIVRTLFQGRT